MRLETFYVGLRPRCVTIWRPEMFPECCTLIWVFYPILHARPSGPCRKCKLPVIYIVSYMPVSYIYVFPRTLAIVTLRKIGPGILWPWCDWCDHHVKVMWISRAAFSDCVICQKLYVLCILKLWDAWNNGNAACTSLADPLQKPGLII